jgi:hypothetical protein
MISSWLIWVISCETVEIRTGNVESQVGTARQRLTVSRQGTKLRRPESDWDTEIRMRREGGHRRERGERKRDGEIKEALTNRTWKIVIALPAYPECSALLRLSPAPALYPTLSHPLPLSLSLSLSLHPSIYLAVCISIRLSLAPRCLGYMQVISLTYTRTRAHNHCLIVL